MQRRLTISQAAARLHGLNQEIGDLRRQQRSIVDLLRDKVALGKTRSMTKSDWVGILRASGLGDDQMWRWHVAFEHLAPEAHQDFLESLGLGAAEISEIRVRSRPERTAGSAGGGGAS